VPQSRIYTTLDKDVIQGIVSSQERKVQKYLRKKMREGDDSDPEDTDNKRPKVMRPPYVALILDDVGNLEHIKTDPDLKRMIFNGRHYYMFVVLCVQASQKRCAPLRRSIPTGSSCSQGTHRKQTWR
jgi:hypothetical protein